MLTESITPQIIIKEKVDINPQVEILPSNPSVNTVALNLQWTPATTEASIQVGSSICHSDGYTGYQSGGSLSFQVNDYISGPISFILRFNSPCDNPHVDAQYQISFNGEIVQNSSFSLGGCNTGSSIPTKILSYTAPHLITNYSVNLNNDQSCILTPTAIEIITTSDCSYGNSWNSGTEPINFMITTGGEFVSFYDQNRQIIGDNFSGTYSDYGNINIIQDSVYSGNEMKQFIVQSEWAGVIKTDSVEIHQQTGDAIVANTNNNDSLYNGQQVSVELYANDYGGQCTIFFPFEVTYNAEIINGNEYGNLIDPNSDEKVQSFTGLSQWFGYANFSYVADGISTEVLDTIIIRVSTTDPIIPNTDLYLFIKPPPIYVITVPEVLAASDTAEVIIKRRNTDGTLTDFPVGQNFELAVLDGCVNGNFMVDGVIDVYFANAVQPIKFVTADSLDSEVDSVLIRVGTDVGGGGSSRPVGNIKEEEKMILEKRKGLDTLRAGFEKMIADRKAKMLMNTKEVEHTPPIEVPIVTQCALDEPTYQTYWQGFASVGNECVTYTCSEVILKPSFTYESFANGTFNEDPCNDEQSRDNSKTVAGIFSVLWGRTAITAIEYFKTENLYACFDPVFSKWKFGTTLPLYPYFQTIMDICLTNIINKGYKYLYDISEIQSIWNDPDVCEAKKDLEGHKSYPSKVRTGGYIFLEVEMAHEMSHGQDFQWVIDSLQTAFLYPTLDLLEVTCGNYDQENKKANDQNDAKQIYFKYLQKVIAGETVGGVRTYNGFEQRLKIGYENHTNQSFIVNGKKVDHENYINSRPTVTNTINVLLSEFENIWNCN